MHKILKLYFLIPKLNRISRMNELKSHTQKQQQRIGTNTHEWCFVRDIFFILFSFIRVIHSRTYFFTYL